MCAATLLMAPSSCCSAVTAAPTARFLQDIAEHAEFSTEICLQAWQH